MCGRGRKFNNVKAGMHPPIYYAGGRSFTFKWAPAMDTSSPLNARYASYGRYLCRDDKFNRRLETRLEIRETTRFLPHTCFFPPLSGKYTYSMIFFLNAAPLLSLRLVHASITLDHFSPPSPFAIYIFPEIHTA